MPRRSYPEFFFFYVLGYAAVRAGAVMGILLPLLILFMLAGLYLLLSPLSLYFWHFKSTDEPNYTLSSDNQESTTVLYKLVSGIVIVAAAAACIFMFTFIGIGSDKSEVIRFEQPLTLEQTYDYLLAYTLERCDKAELIDFYIEFEGTNALRSGEPSYAYLIFQDAPGFCPNRTRPYPFIHTGTTIM
jgi:hypothetical protein